MSTQTKSLYTAIGLISLFCLLTPLSHAQTTPATAQLRPALQILDSTKDQDGLIGAVRRVKTEYARIDLKQGQPIEGPRQLLELTTYGIRGNRVDNVSYPIPESVAGREEYKYDPRGNIVEKTLRDERGAVLTREVNEYVFDEVGNWTKMITSLVLIENGQLKREPIEVIYRTLTYYAIESSPEPIASAAPASTTETKQAAELEVNASPIQKSSGIVVERSSVAPAPTTETKQAAESVVNASDVQKGSGIVVEQSSVAPAPTSIRSQITSPGTTAPTERIEPRPTENASNSSASETPPTPQVSTNSETSTVNNNGANEKSTLAPQKTAVVETPSNPASVATVERKLVDSPKREESAVGVNVSSQPEPRKTAATTERESTANAVVLNPAPSEPAPVSATAKAFEMYQIGLQKFDAGDVKGAIEAYLESVRLEPGSAIFQTNLGHAYFTLKKDKEAMKAFKEAVRLNPQLAEAFYGLGFVSFRSRNIRDALDAFKRAAALSPDMAKAHYGLALAYVELDKMDDMLHEYRILQRLDSKLAAKLTKALPDVDFSCKGTRYCR